MQIVSCVVLAVCLLGGCAQLTGSVAAQPPQQDGFYECERAPQADDAGSPEHRTVNVQTDPVTHNAILSFAGDRRQVLSPLPNGAGLYSNQLYAWRAGAQTGVLTDIVRISTFACKRVGAAAG